MKHLIVILLIIWITIYIIQLIVVLAELLDNGPVATKKEIKQWLNPFGLYFMLREKYNTLKDD